MLLKKAALRRFILPAVLRELLLTGCVLKSVVLAHCAETCCCSWSQDSTAEEVACPKRALLIRLATQRECCVTSTSMRCLVFSGLRLRQTRRNSCPSSHKPPMLVKMNGRHDDSVRRLSRGFFSRGFFWPALYFAGLKNVQKTHRRQKTLMLDRNGFLRAS